MVLNIGHIEIFCRNMQISKNFYINILGFELVEIQNDVFIWLRCNNILVLLRPGEPDFSAEEYKNTNSGIVLYTNDLNNTKLELISRGLEFKGTDGSENCLTFTDPDGNWFQLVNPEEH